MSLMTQRKTTGPCKADWVFRAADVCVIMEVWAEAATVDKGRERPVGQAGHPALTRLPSSECPLKSNHISPSSCQQLGVSHCYLLPLVRVGVSSAPVWTMPLIHCPGPSGRVGTPAHNQVTPLCALQEDA